MNAVFFVAVVRLVEQGVPPTTIGVVEALAGAGGVIGALIAPFIIDRMRTGHLTMAVAWVWVPLLVPLVFWSSPWLVGSMLFVGLLLNPAGNAGAQSYRVAITPDALQGRIASSSQFLGFTTIPFAPLLGGWLLETFGAGGRDRRAARRGGAGGADPDPVPVGAVGAAAARLADVRGVSRARRAGRAARARSRSRGR